MSLYEDAWFMNESLAFYMSTNTFTNPIFASNFDESRECVVDERDRLNHEASTSTNRPWKKFCDSLVFSVRSKIYVLELNFKRHLKSLKRFTCNNFPAWTSARRSKRAAPAVTGSKHEKPSSGVHFEDEFWRNIEPSCKKSLDRQQEKILYRLEQVVQAKRHSQLLFNMDRARFNYGHTSPRVSHPDATDKLDLTSASSDSLSGAAATVHELVGGANITNGLKSRVSFGET